ncbi:uncharacterized protein LOC133832417 [Humulus lupulus]|uniref:uncharacterized protein LOC133832417 n=1 Tax=Humulus lupulus TaxID=3486 RepID=UPI002B413603|nr:uncharacterized protein LOC133832417 [Humulus lupulus]
MTTWQEFTDRLLMKYFPPTKNAKLRNEITSFQQLDEESLYEAWEQFNELLRKCLHHGIPHSIRMETFYNGLNTHTKMVVDASRNGALLAQSNNEAYKMLERISNNKYQWPTSREPTGRKVVDVHEVDALTSLAAQVSSMSNILMNMSVGMSPQMGQPRGQLVEVSCVYCGNGNTFDNFLYNPVSVCFMGNQNRSNPQANTFNQGWGQHQNLSWNDQGVVSSNSYMPNRPTYPPRYTQQVPQPRPQQAVISSSLETLMKEYMAKIDVVIQSHTASLRNLEIQMGQLSNDLRNRPQGSLTSDIESQRQEGKKRCKAITLRNGKELEIAKENYGHEGEPSSIQSNEKTRENIGTSILTKPASAQNAITSTSQQNCPEIQKFQQPVPFPHRFQNQK